MLTRTRAKNAAKVVINQRKNKFLIVFVDTPFNLPIGTIDKAGTADNMVFFVSIIELFVIKLDNQAKWPLLSVTPICRQAWGGLRCRPV